MTPGEIWSDFGNAGVFIGGAPATDDYSSEGLLDPSKTCFELLFVKQATATDPTRFLAMRLLRNRAGRLYDSMECLMRRNQMDNALQNVVVYNWIREHEWLDAEDSEEDEAHKTRGEVCIEADAEVSVDYLLAAYPNIETWVGPNAKSLKRKLANN